jgi:hypothetical protein
MTSQNIEERAQLLRQMAFNEYRIPRSRNIVLRIVDVILSFMVSVVVGIVNVGVTAFDVVAVVVVILITIFFFSFFLTSSFLFILFPFTLAWR